MSFNFPAKHVHVFGASGAGVSTLGRELARRLGLEFFDSDDFFWEPSDPPYRTPRERTVRRGLLLDALGKSERWVLAGSCCGWGDDVRPLLDLAVFVTTSTPVRMERLRAREAERFGPRIAEGGDMHESSKAFLAWAAKYDDAPPDMRSRQLHEIWMQELTCRVHRVDGSRAVEVLCVELVRSCV